MRFLSIVYLFTIKLLAKLRVVKYRIMYQHKLTANNCYFEKNVRLKIFNRSKGKVNIGHGVIFDEYCRIISTGGSIEVGANSYFNVHCKLDSHNSITIGEDCMFGPNVSFFDNNHRHSDVHVPFSKQGHETKPIVIGSNVWIGSNSMVTAGVTIGNNVVVGANSVVTKDLKANGVYVGSPAKRIKDLPFGSNVNLITKKAT